MPQVNNLCTLTLKNTAHDIDGSIVPIKKTGGCNQPYGYGSVGIHTGIALIDLFWIAKVKLLACRLTIVSLTIGLKGQKA
jgi:hypothetical protein